MGVLFTVTCMFAQATVNINEKPNSIETSKKENQKRNQEQLERPEKTHIRHHLYIVKLTQPALSSIKNKLTNPLSMADFKISPDYFTHKKKLANERAQFISDLKRAIPNAVVIRFHEFASNSIIVQAPTKSQKKLKQLFNVSKVFTSKNQNLL